MRKEKTEKRGVSRDSERRKKIRGFVGRLVA